MDLPFSEQPSVLIHDLVSHWNAVYLSAQLLDEVNLSPANVKLYEDIFHRNTLSTQLILVQLEGYLSHDGLFNAIEESLKELKLQRTASTLTRLRFLFFELSQLIVDVNRNRTLL